MKKKIAIDFGALADSLKTQLTLQNFSCEETTLKKFEKLRDSINMLYIHSYLTDSEKDKKFRKLFNNLKKAVKLDE